jgi:hypothetical protein
MKKVIIRTVSSRFIFRKNIFLFWQGWEEEAQALPLPY